MKHFMKKERNEPNEQHWQLIYVQCTLLFSFYVVFLSFFLLWTDWFSSASKVDAEYASSAKLQEKKKSGERKRHRKEIISYGLSIRSGSEM